MTRRILGCNSSRKSPILVQKTRCSDGPAQTVQCCAQLPRCKAPRSYEQFTPLSGITKHRDEFDQPARKQVAVEEPKEHEPLKCANLPAPKAFRSRRRRVKAAKSMIRGRRFGARARRPSLRWASTGEVVDARTCEQRPARRPRSTTSPRVHSNRRTLIGTSWASFVPAFSTFVYVRA
jgi:hypothetical protein